MIDFTIETEIDRPAGEVFTCISDPEKLPTWQTNTVSAAQLDDGPLGLGTKLREVHRGPGGKEIASLVEVSEFDPDRVFALRMPIDGASRSIRAAARRESPSESTDSRAAQCASLNRLCESCAEAAVQGSLRDAQAGAGGTQRGLTESVR